MTLQSEKQREAQIQDDIRKELGNPSKYPGLAVFRNNTGVLMDQNGRRVAFGLCKGSSDLIGWYRGRFIAIEVKTPEGSETEEQRLFGAGVERDGGAYCVARSVEDAVRFIERLRREAEQQRRSA